MNATLCDPGERGGPPPRSEPPRTAADAGAIGLLLLAAGLAACAGGLRPSGDPSRSTADGSERRAGVLGP
ncbi:MAG: hypothetical protein ACRDHY_06350, partial [Anaerolineales bacterium]